ncbi:hypothetical protein T02_5387 [Trichinella nativa]|uniref:Uncharacterized protein n=1 Tax=Trichinella nativa TaxID=6335 RepID=A0A0V1LD48_9BILA|nr:hypothetical protein T02_5387 [Trichinella nativa]
MKIRSMADPHGPAVSGYNDSFELSRLLQPEHQLQTAALCRNYSTMLPSGALVWKTTSPTAFVHCLSASRQTLTIVQENCHQIGPDRRPKARIGNDAKRQ